MKENAKKTTYKLAIAAIFIALSTVLSIFKIEMPLGGGLTFCSMLPTALFSCFYGIKWGLFMAFANSLVQMMLSFAEVCSWGLSPIILVLTFLLDYILAYTVIGLAGIFAKKGLKGICLGTAFAVFLRFVCHFITGGAIFDIWCEWENPWIYSLCYNGAYMLPEIIITACVITVLFKVPQIKKMMN